MGVGMLLTTDLRKNKALKVVLLSLVAVSGFLSICGDSYVRFHYAAVMPRVPQPETGRIYPVPAQYGGTIYLNQEELRLRDFVRYELTYIFVGSMILCFGIGTSLGWWSVVPRPDVRARTRE
jgi:hypothetical protein